MPLTSEQKEQRRIYNKKYREEHKEESKIYRDSHKEERKELNKAYRETHKEERKQYVKNNREYINEQVRKYKSTYEALKKNRIRNWKFKNVVCDDWDSLYDIYTNTDKCNNCGVIFVDGDLGLDKKCLDHCHISGEFREIVCSRCNLAKPHQLIN